MQRKFDEVNPNWVDVLALLLDVQIFIHFRAWALIMAK